MYSCSGAVHPRVYLWYARSQGIYLVAVWLLLFVLFEALNVYANFWLTFWTDDPRLSGGANRTGPASVAPSTQSTNFSLFADAASFHNDSVNSSSGTTVEPSMVTSSSAALVNSSSASASPSLLSIQFYYLRAISFIVLARIALFVVHSVLYVIGTCLSSRAIHSKVMGIHYPHTSTVLQ